MFKKPNSEKQNNRKSKSKGKKQLALIPQEAELWHTTYVDIWANVKSKLEVSNNLYLNKKHKTYYYLF